jgi:energy-coupling factor transporter ATP-binding protein EcfA2
MNHRLDTLHAGPVHGILIAISLSGMVLAAMIWMMEFSGWTITRRGFARNQVRWNAATIGLIAVSAALYIAGRLLQIQLIPGVGGINPTLSLAPIFAVLFGLPGAIGVTFSMPIGDALSGALTIGSLAGCLSHTFLTWLPYKLVREPNFHSPKAIRSYFTWAILVGPCLHIVIMSGWFDYSHVLPVTIAWGVMPLVLVLNHVVTPAIVSPILMAILYPVVKMRGLYWRDSMSPTVPGDGARSFISNGRAVEMESVSGAIIEVKDLHFLYPERLEEALKGISFTVRPTEFIGITGASGAGKTTLALCLRGLIPHVISGRMRGEIYICGQDVRRLKVAAMGEQVGMVFQDPEAQIIGLTVAEDLAFSPENYEWPSDRIRAATSALLELVQLEGMGSRDTFGLSGGQKQRVALAGALMLSPSLLILDEPTSELDPSGRKEVFNALRQLQAETNATVIVIEHEIEQLVEFCDRIFVMDDGHIVAQGTPREVFRNVDIFHRISGERVPASVELMHALHQDGLINTDSYGLHRTDAARAVSQLLDNLMGS